MFFPEGAVRVHVYGQPVDMHRSFDGLYALVRHVLGLDPLSGAGLGHRGHSKDHRPDLKQMVVGMVLDNTGNVLSRSLVKPHTAAYRQVGARKNPATMSGSFCSRRSV